MNETTFLECYANSVLLAWWNIANPTVKKEMLHLLGCLNSGPLGSMDQFTVDKHVGQPDRWMGSRLVFAIRNRTAAGSIATANSILMSLPLNPNGTGVVATVAGVFDKKKGIALKYTAGELRQFLDNQKELVRALVDEKLELRRVNGRLLQRNARRPFEYSRVADA